MTTDFGPDITPEQAAAIEESIASIVDGWYPHGTRIDWDDLIDRVERHSGVDLGGDMLSPTVLEIQKQAKELRRA